MINSALMRRLIFFCLLSLLTTAGCAYVEFSRKYEISDAFDNYEVNDIQNFLEGFFEEKGLILRHKYTELYPNNIWYMVYEIPRAPEKKREGPSLIVKINSTKHVDLEHREWFLTPSSKDNYPRDYLASVKSDLESQMKKIYGENIKLSFTSRSYY